MYPVRTLLVPCDMQALMWATCRGHIRVVHVLLEGGANAELRCCDGSQAVDLAFLQGQTQVSSPGHDITSFIWQQTRSYLVCDIILYITWLAFKRVACRNLIGRCMVVIFSTLLLKEFQ